MSKLRALYVPGDRIQDVTKEDEKHCGEEKPCNFDEDSYTVVSLFVGHIPD